MVCCWNRHHCIVLNRLLSTNKSLKVYIFEIMSNRLRSHQVLRGAIKWWNWWLWRWQKRLARDGQIFGNHTKKDPYCNSCKLTFGVWEICKCKWVDNSQLQIIPIWASYKWVGFLCWYFWKVKRVKLQIYCCRNLRYWIVPHKKTVNS